MTRYIVEDHANATEGHGIGSDRQPLADTIFADSDNLRGDLYRFGVREYGRCVGKVYSDAGTEHAKHIGYAFQKRQRYEDTGDTYLHETWLTVVDVEHRADIVTAVEL